MHLHPLAIVIGVILGAKFGGLVGVFCAVPLVGVGSVIWRHYREFRDIQLLILEHEEEMAAAALLGPAPADPGAPETPPQVDPSSAGTDVAASTIASDAARLT
jgi:hypothetical protein